MRSTPTRGGRRTVLAVVALMGLTCGSTAVAGLGRSIPAEAAPTGVTLTYRCAFPLIGDQELKVHISTNMPKVAVVDKPTVPRLTFDTVSTVNGKTTTGLRAQDAATLEGAARASAVLEAPQFANGLAVAPYAAMDKTRIPPGGPFEVGARGSTPGLWFERPGKGRLVLKDLTLYPVLRKADGGLTDLGDDVKVPCTRTAGDPVLAEFDIVESDDQPPSRPGRPALTGQTARTAALDWGGSDDDIGLSGYEIYNGDTRLAVTYGGDTAVTVTGLEPNTDYSLTVKARDYGGNLSQASDPVSFRTGPDVPERVPPTTPGKPSVTHTGGTWVRMKWPESTDNVGVAAYDIFQDGRPAASFPGTGADGWVEGLQPLRTYTFTIRARDAAGNVSGFSPPITVRTDKGTPAGCGAYPDAPAKLASRGCVYMAGFANVEKLHGAAVINEPDQNPVFANVAYRTVEKESIEARFRFSGPLRSRATFLTFGFMPTTATIELTQVGEGRMTGRYVHNQGYDLTATTEVSVRIHDATASGAPLDLGEHCRSSRPMELKLTAEPADFTDILEGGLLTGDGTIPPFSGCGGNEDMDRIFIGAISGAGNYLKIRQGPICRTDTARCLPVAPER